MAGKYYSNSVDKVSQCEPKRFSAATFSSYFKGDTELQQAGTNTTNITLDGYAINGTTCKAVEKGRCPSAQTRIWSRSSPGSYSWSRTDSALVIGDATFTANDFHCKIIPKEIVIMVVGGGGGGGGIPMSSSNLGCGGGGGGGGIAIGRIDISTHTTGTIKIGAGGTKGKSAATESNRYGTSGEASTVTVGSTTILTANGGGRGGVGKGDNHGSGGSGGSASADPDYCITSATMTGGTGNSNGNHASGNTSGLTFAATAGTEDYARTVADSQTMNKTNVKKIVPTDLSTVVAEITYNYNQDSSRFSGGGSYGSGAYSTPTHYKSSSSITVPLPAYVQWGIQAAENGGGGCSGVSSSYLSNGASGFAAIYY